MDARARVACTRLRAALSAASCATRHAARYPSGRRRRAPRFVPCGTCERGAEVLALLRRSGWAPPPNSQPAEVLAPEQRAGRERWVRSFPSHFVPSETESDPLAEAAMGCPDDDGISVDAW